MVVAIQSLLVQSSIPLFQINHIKSEFITENFQNIYSGNFLQLNVIPHCTDHHINFQSKYNLIYANFKLK